MSLISKSLRSDQRLQAAATSDPSHILKNARGDHVSKIQRALLQLFESADITRTELSETHFGETTEKTVKAFKSQKGKEIINHSYQISPDAIVGKMTLAELDKQIASKEKDDPDFLFFKDEQKNTVKADLRRSKIMVSNALRRLRFVSGFNSDGGMLIVPRNFQYYDTILKVLNVFHINAFRDGDIPASTEIDIRLKREVDGFKGLPSGPGDLSDSLNFARLLENFVRLEFSLSEPFDKEFYTSGTFRGGPLGFFSAFVDARNPADTTVRFTHHYFDSQIMPTQDDRAVTIAHERSHTIFRANGHPGTGDNPFCVRPHRGDPNVKTAEQALMNPYCYEWLITSLQPEYIAARQPNNGCGT